MALYRCEVSFAKKGSGGRTAAAHAAYLMRDGKYAGRDDVEEVTALNMPTWAAHDPATFWAASDEFERANGTTYREFTLALPRELTPDQRSDLVRDFVGRQLGGQHVAQWAIHTPAAMDGGEQPHVHIMYSERTLDGIDRDPDEFFKRYNAKSPEKGGCRKDSFGGDAERLVAARKLWADVQNEHLERHGHDVRVDHRTNAEQGIDRKPQPKLGAHLHRFLKQADRQVLAQASQVQAELDAALKGLAGERQQARDSELAAFEQQQKASRAAMSPLDKARAELAELLALKQRDAGRRAQDDERRSAWWGAEFDFKATLKGLKQQHEQLGRDTEAWKVAHPWKWATHIQLGMAVPQPIVELDAKRNSVGAAHNTKLAEFEAAKSAWAEEEKPIKERFAARAVLDAGIEKAERRVHDLEKPLREAAEAAKRAEAEKGEALRLFKDIASKRRAGLLEWRDGGSKWGNLPEAARNLVDAYVAGPKAVSDRIISNFEKASADSISRVKEQLEQSNSRDHGMSR